MKKSLFFFAAAALLPMAGAAELKFYLNCDTMKAPQGVTRFSSSMRLVPGKFGKGLLIERRTVNSFAPAETVLGDGVKLSGKNNTLVMPANGVANLPLTAIQPKKPHTLSFRYRGEGKITVTFGGREWGVFQAAKDFQSAAVVIVPEEDSGTLRIRSEKAVELTEVMFDKQIGFANTYHAPGAMRNVDRIDIKPEIFNGKAGAVSCWIKAPWLNPGSRYATATALFRARTGAGNASPGLYISIWDNYMYCIYYSPDKRSTGCGYKMAELPQSKDGWSHFVYNWKEEKGNISLSLIVNGEKVFKAQKIGKAAEGIKEFTLGYVNGAYLNGVLDDFGIFSAPLTQAEAKKIFNAKEPLVKLYGK